MRIHTDRIRDKMLFASCDTFRTYHCLGDLFTSYLDKRKRPTSTNLHLPAPNHSRPSAGPLRRRRLSVLRVLPYHYRQQSIPPARLATPTPPRTLPSARHHPPQRWKHTPPGDSPSDYREHDSHPQPRRDTRRPHPDKYPV